MEMYRLTVMKMMMYTELAMNELIRGISRWACQRVLQSYRKGLHGHLVEGGGVVAPTQPRGDVKEGGHSSDQGTEVGHCQAQQVDVHHPLATVDKVTNLPNNLILTFKLGLVSTTRLRTLPSIPMATMM